jgi:hypothetical protein
MFCFLPLSLFLAGIVVIFVLAYMLTVKFSPSLLAAARTQLTALHGPAVTLAAPRARRGLVGDQFP